MANAFRAIGGTNALAAGTGQLVDTAFGMRAFEERGAINALRARGAEVDIAKAEMELNKAKQQYEFENSPIDVEMLPGFSRLSQEVKSDMINYAQMASKPENPFIENVGGRFTTTIAKARQIAQLMETDNQFMEQVYTKEIASWGQRLDQANADVMAGKKPKDNPAQIQERLKTLYGARNLLKGQPALQLSAGERAVVPGIGVVGKGGEKEYAPSLTRSIDAEADRLGLQGKDRLDFIIGKHGEAAGVRTAAQQEELGIPAEAAASIAELGVLENMAKETEELYSVVGPNGKPQGEDWVGKINAGKGAVREFTGKITADEVIFRKHLKDQEDALLRARSGAQINEQEFKRLRKFLAKTLDQPEVFFPTLKRFRRELADVKAERLRMATIKKKDIRGTEFPVQPNTSKLPDPLGIR